MLNPCSDSSRPFSRLDLAKLLRSPRITKAHMCADCCDVPQMCSKNSADQAQTQKSSSESGSLGQTNAHLYLYHIVIYKGYLYLYSYICYIYTKDMYKIKKKKNMYICVDMYTCTYLHMCTCSHVDPSMYTCVHQCTCVRMHVHDSYVNAPIWVKPCKVPKYSGCIHMYIYMYTCILIYLHIAHSQNQ